MNLSHYVDLLRHLSGRDADEVRADLAGNERAGDVEDAVSVAVRLDSGALVSVVGCSSARGTTQESELRLWGRDGQVVLEPRPRFYSLRRIDGLRAARWQTFGRLPPMNARAVYFSRLATAIAEGREPDVTAADGLRVQAVIEAAYRSAESGDAVRPDDLIAATE